MKLVCNTVKGVIRFEFENLEMQVIEPKRDFDVPYLEIEEENVTVYIDNIKQETFGESFSGYKYNANEALESTVIEFLNNNTSVEWIEVPECIRKFKEDFFESSGLVVAGREVPQKIIEHGYGGGKILTLHLASDGFSAEYKVQNPDSKDYDGTTAYTDWDGTCALLDAKGNVITDIEEFYESGIASMLKNEHIVFGKEEFKDFCIHEA